MTDNLADVLKGLRVVELGSPWTAFAGRLLAGLGAEVLLLHGPDGPVGDDEAEKVHLHWMKRAHRIPGDHSEAAQSLASWLQRADVVLEGCEEQEREALGLVADDTVTQGLIHVSITPWGATYVAPPRPATDFTVTAAGGMASQIGHPTGPPVPAPSGQAVRLAGVHAAIGVLLARRRGPQHVDVAAVKAVAAALETGALTYLYEDRVMPRPGNAHPLVPHQLFSARDGWLAGGLGGSPRMWDGLVEWMAEHDMAADLAAPDRRDPARLDENRPHIMATVAAFVAMFDRDDFAEEAQRRRLPWATVLRARELSADGHLAARGALVDVPAESGGGRDVDVAVGHLRAPSTTTWTPRDRSSRTATQTDPPLQGVRVLDLTWVLAGPSTTRVLADFGAEVIKVESMGRPDPTRFAPMFRLNRDPDADHEGSGYFNNVNRGKRSVQVDLRTDDGRRLVRQLALEADVLVENYSAGVLERLGLSYEDLREERPDLVVARLSGLGQTGPRRSWVSYADAVSALSGLTDLVRDHDDTPVGVVFGLADLVGGLHGALAIVAALDEDTGGGEIDLSQLEAMVSQIGADPLRASRDAPPPPQAELRAILSTIGGRWLAVDATTTETRRGLIDLLGDSRDATDSELRAALEAHVANLPASVAATRLRNQGIPAEAVAGGRDIVEHEIALRDFYEVVTHHTMGVTVVEGVVAHLSHTPAQLLRGAPLLGADTTDVLTGLGVDEQEQARLSKRGVLR
jgi:crotonobetainyl-CoA:carnitine CoA-transferase CaiB-like acyl-CoA transferase